MGIDVARAYGHAALIDENAEKLDSARSLLVDYMQQLSDNWVGQETQYMIRAINQQIAKIDQVKQEIYSIGRDIRYTATEIRNEEIEEQRRQEELRRREEERMRQEQVRQANQAQIMREQANRRH